MYVTGQQENLECMSPIRMPARQRSSTMAKSKQAPVDRRDFLRGAGIGAAALVSNPVIAGTQQSEPSEQRPLSATTLEADIVKMKGKIASGDTHAR